MTDKLSGKTLQRQRQRESRGSGSWVPLLGSAAIASLLLALVIVASVLK